MGNDERKKVVEAALVDSFVEEYKSYKNTINLINNDLSDKNINFQYTYDEFCINFLSYTLNSIDSVDIFDFDRYEEFYSNFLKFNLYNLKNMLSDKLNELGYKYEDIYGYNIIKFQSFLK